MNFKEEYVLKYFTSLFLILTFFSFARPVHAQLKLGYIDSQKILENYKEARDAQQQIAEINKGWEEEAQNMQREIMSKRDALESQALLLSDTKRKEKETALQNLALKFQQYQQEKWGPQGAAYRKQAEVMKPVLDKINKGIRELGAEEKYDYIFDVVSGNILYVSSDQPDLTDKVLEKLNKTVSSNAASSKN